MSSLSDLTVVVPTCNEAANVGRFLASIPHDVHVIVVDKSTDDTCEIVRRTRPAKTTVLECGGTLTEARQLGAERADTRWLLFTDADVAFGRGYFERVAQLLAAVRAGADARGVSVWYGPKLSPDAYRHHYRSIAFGQLLVSLVGIPAATGSNMLVAARAFRAVGGFDRRLTCNEDSELGWRIARAGFACCYDPRLVVWSTDHRRLHRGRLRKTSHSVLRCVLLYFDLLPQRWRSHDWGYWSTPTHRQPSGPAPGLAP